MLDKTMIFVSCRRLLARQLLICLVTGLLLLAQSTAVWAWPFKKTIAADDPSKVPPNSIRPPAADAMKADCEPIRQRVVALNNKPVFIKAFTKPAKAYQIHRHRSCIKRVSGQEWLYLKNVQIKGQPGQTPTVHVEQVGGQAFAPKQAEASGADSSGTEFSSARPQAAPGKKRPEKTLHDFPIQSLPPGLPEEHSPEGHSSERFSP